MAKARSNGKWLYRKNMLRTSFVERKSGTVGFWSKHNLLEFRQNFLTSITANGVAHKAIPRKWPILFTFCLIPRWRGVWTSPYTEFVLQHEHA